MVSTINQSSHRMRHVDPVLVALGATGSDLPAPLARCSLCCGAIHRRRIVLPPGAGKEA